MKHGKHGQVVTEYFRTRSKSLVEALFHAGHLMLTKSPLLRKNVTYCINRQLSTFGI